MKVEDPPAFLVQWFHHKSKYLPKGDESSWLKYTRFTVQNATTIILFIATAKINPVFKNISAGNEVINLPRMLLPASRADRVNGYILPARSAVNPCSCTTIWRIIATSVVVTRSATIPCLFQSLLPLPHHPCQNSLASRISSACVTLSISFLWRFPCSTWAKIHSAIFL